MKRPAALAAIAATLLAGAGGALGGALASSPQGSEPSAQVPRAKLKKAAAWAHREARRADLLSARLAHRESYQDTLTLAGVVYPRAPLALIDRILRCESGSGGGEPRAWAKNPRSSAGGRGQYLDSTWAGTPEGRAGLSRFDPVAAVLATARHFHNGGSASPWLASAGCWG
jgi:hypothetical protein